jgi:hypothetical protein
MLTPRVLRRKGRTTYLGPSSTSLYSPYVGEENFCEVRRWGLYEGGQLRS